METSEEKTAPASRKKLTDARKKGQLARSDDTVKAAGFVVCVAVLATFGATIAGQLGDLLTVALQSAANVGLGTKPVFDDLVGEMAGPLVLTLVSALAPLILAVAAVSILVNIILNRGMIFTFEPMKPSVEKFNPVKGLKKMFGKRGLFETIKALIKLVFMLTVASTILLYALNGLVRLPSCGFDCLAGGLLYPLARVLGAAMLLFVIAAALDILMQRQLFLDDMKMTKTEVKQERKDQDGDPNIRSARRKLAREASQETGPIGAIAASVFITGREMIVGLRYEPTESRVPVVVAKASGAAHARLMAAARASEAPILDYPQLAGVLSRKGQPGKPIPAEAFTEVAQVLTVTGLSKRR